MQRILLVALTLFALAAAPMSLAQDAPRGVLTHTTQALEGYTLVAPQIDSKVYLIDNAGQVVHEWEVGSRSREAHLRDNGNIMVVQSAHADIDFSLFDLGYAPDGAIAEYSWDGELLWKRAFLGSLQHQHHGIDILPNGNVLALLWDFHPIDEAYAMGLDPAFVEAVYGGDDYFLPDLVVEIESGSGDIVWTWDAFDHLIQNFDSSLPNYGQPADNPQRIDINYHQYAVKNLALDWSAGQADWMHSNAVNYNPQLNQIALSVLRFDELWIFKRSDSTEAAAGPDGDLIYRWGNPFTSGRGDIDADRKLFQQHDVQWIDPGLPGAGNMLVYNNRNNVVREDEVAADEYSSILELRLPLREDGSYDWSAEVEIVWEYDQDFYSRIISGVQRLPNGNTLITEGTGGRLIEVTPAGEVAWEFVNPVNENNNWLFRTRKYAADHPGLAGRELVPGAVIASPDDSG